MSQRLIDRNPDLKRLRDEGYTIEVRGPFLLMYRVPYVTTERQVQLGTLVSTLAMSGETVTRPDTHVVHFVGEQPCHKDGRPIQQITHQIGKAQLDQGLTVDRSFSNKPADGYKDYYHKMSTYADIISGPAHSLNPENSAKQFVAIKADAEESVFQYVDTASSRAGIKAVTRKLESAAVGIIGVGGTGSYILDLVAKTPVREIRLFDGDKLYSHNAFRLPGAVSLEDLERQHFKVDYLQAVYSRLHRNIVAHRCFLDEASLELLEGLDFAFVSMDAGETKAIILRALEQRGISYVDCGMGIETVDGSLVGQVRTTASVDGHRSHVWEKNAISFSGEDAGNEYGWNIQIAELNALNAALAVIKWKKLAGFYLDLENELHSIYPIDGNTLINAYHRESDDRAEAA